MQLIDLTNKQFAELTVIKYIGKSKWLAWCSCGRKTIVHGAKLKNGHTRSCGHLQRDYAKTRVYIHGKSQTKEYYRYKHMMSRCYKPSDPAYKNYGGRGIKVADRWCYGEKGLTGFECFIKDVGDRPTPEHTINRIDNDGDYEPDNVEWSTWIEQNSNRRSNVTYTFNDICDTQIGWSRRLGISQSRFRLYVVNHGPTEAINYYLNKLGINL